MFCEYCFGSLFGTQSTQLVIDLTREHTGAGHVDVIGVCSPLQFRVAHIVGLHTLLDDLL